MVEVRGQRVDIGTRSGSSTRHGVLLVLLLGAAATAFLCSLPFGTVAHAQEPEPESASEPAPAADQQPTDFPRQVDVMLQLVDVPAIDERATTVDIDARLVAEWTDHEEAWTPCETGDLELSEGAAAAERLAEGVWWPNFKIAEAVGPREISARALEIHCDGRVRYRERFLATVGQDGFNFYEFPFDDQTLVVTVEPYSQMTDQIVFTTGGDLRLEQLGQTTSNPDVTTRQTFSWETAEWSVNYRGFADPIVENQSRDYASASFSAVLHRKWGFYMLNIVLPLGLIVGISWSMFWINPPMKMSDRINVCIACFLTVVAFDFLTNSQLPRLSYLTRLDNLYILSYVMVALTIIVSLFARHGKRKAAADGVASGAADADAADGTADDTPDGAADIDAADGTADLTGDAAADAATPTADEKITKRIERVDWHSRYIFPSLYIGIGLIALLGPRIGDPGAPDVQERDTGGERQTKSALLEAGQQVAGQIDESAEVRLYDIDLDEGGAYEVTVEPAGGFDAVLTLTGPDGDTGPDGEGWLSDENSAGGEERVAIVASTGGTHRVAVSGWEGSTGSFDITLSNAPTSLEVGQIRAGAVDEVGQVRYYSVELDAGRAYDVIVEPDADFDPILTITEPSGESRQSDDRTAGGEEQAVVASTGGPHVIGVTGWEDSTGSFDVTVSEIPTDLEVGEPTSGGIGETGEVHTYRVELDEDEAYQITVEPDADLDPILTITEPDGQVRESDDPSPGAAERIVGVSRTGGVHVITVAGWEDSMGSFEVTVSDIPTTDVEVDEPTSDEIDEAGDVRSYRVELDADAAYQMTIEPDTDLDPILTITAPDGQVRQSDTALEGGDEQIELVSSGGVHVITVSGWADTSGRFTLTVRPT